MHFDSEIKGKKVVKFISKNAYIMVAMKGYSFCKAAKKSFMLGRFFPSFSAISKREMQKLPLFSWILMRNEGKNRSVLANLAQIAMVSIISAYLILMGKLAITIGCTALIWTIFDNSIELGFPYVFTDAELTCCCNNACVDFEAQVHISCTLFPNSP